MNSRRKFLKNLTAVGATVPLVTNIEAKPKKIKDLLFYVVEVRFGVRKY